MKDKISILIIDDDSTSVKILESILRREGFQTFQANSSAEGRHLASLEIPDLILLDIMMPGEDGFETCLKLKSDPRTTHIPIIFISALMDSQDKVKGLSIGAVDYVTKPFDASEVLARVRIHIRLEQAYKALVENQQRKLQQLHEAQQALLIKASELPKAGFAVYYQAMNEAGGDFYDVIEVGEDIFAYFVADISGHDLEASYVTSALKVLVRQNSGPLYLPEETIRMISRVLQTVLNEDQFVTACYAQLNRLRRTLTVLHAGHPPVLFIPVDGNPVFFKGTGDVLGLFDTIYFNPTQIKVNRGDRIYMYTDGLIEIAGESKKPRDECMSELLSACTMVRELPLDKAVVQIIDHLFPDKSNRGDDLLIMGVEV